MLAALLTVMVSALGQASPSPQWQLVFQDEFEGPSGAAPTADHWTNETGGNGFGNNELESYTPGAANSYLDGKGHLVIEARREHIVGADGIQRDYTSARLVSKGHFSQSYGRFEARVKVPQGQGIWPAFWLLGDDISKAGWPGCGEIDVMEVLGQHPDVCHGTLHGPGYSGSEGLTSSYSGKTSLADDFHIYAVEWGPHALKWYVDGNLYHTVTTQDVAPHEWVFNHPFFIIMNLAVGGQWPGSPDSTTTFPQRLLVDYVRVYKQSP